MLTAVRPSPITHRFGISKNIPCFTHLFFVLVLTLSLLAGPESGRAANSPTPAPAGGIDVLGAIKKTMEHQAAIRIQREQVKLAGGAYRSSGGDFDWRVETYITHREDHAPIPGADPIITTREMSAVGVRFPKLLRSGVSVEPFLQYTESEESASLLLPDDSQEGPLKIGTVGLLFRVPLLQGLGYQNAAAGEIASAFELEAARLSLSHEISFTVHHAAQAFWAYLGAFQRVVVAKEAEERARAVLEKTEILVRADELAAAELVNVHANLADKERSRLAAAQAVVAARAELGMAMGIPPAEIYDLPEPLGPFPDLDRMVLMQDTAANHAWYAETAARHRMDLLAADKQNESLKAGLQAARNRVKPALDLELSLGYDGIESGSSLSRSLKTTSYRQDTPDWSTGVRLSYPLGNNSGEGDLEQAWARYRQGKMRSEELFRAVQTDIGLVRRDLFSLAQEIERSEEAVRHYTTATANEQEKYQMGETTLLDLLTIGDRLDGALLNRITVRQRVAGSLTRLRFVTGMLVRFEEDQGMVTYGDLTTMLLPEGAESP